MSFDREIYTGKKSCRNFRKWIPPHANFFAEMLPQFSLYRPLSFTRNEFLHVRQDAGRIEFPPGRKLLDTVGAGRTWTKHRSKAKEQEGNASGETFGSGTDRRSSFFHPLTPLRHSISTFRTHLCTSRYRVCVPMYK